MLSNTRRSSGLSFGCMDLILHAQELPPHALAMADWCSPSLLSAACLWRVSADRRTDQLSSTNGGEAVSKDSSTQSSWRDKVGTGVSIRTQRRTWGGRADTWDQHNDLGMAKVAAKAIEVADVIADMQCVDLGCGTGRLAFLLAELGADVLGVDVSDAMIERMEAQAKRDGIKNVHGQAVPIERLTLPADSVDLVITNYALHHLLDIDKEKVVNAAFSWLRPGGQLVIADMMLGRGATARDREIIAGKLRIMAKKGIPGYWRILKNAGRYLFRVQERPITPEAWSRLLTGAGFVDVASTVVVAEAAVVKGIKPVS